MSKPIIHDGQTHREMTDTEYAEWQSLCDELDAQAQAKAMAAAAAESGKAKLAALGLSDAEIAALVG